MADKNTIHLVQKVIDTASTDDLKTANEMIVAELRHRRNLKTMSKKNYLKFRQSVKFKNKQGMVVYGEVTKINKKTAIVSEINSPATWKVDISLLEIVNEGEES